LKTTTAHIISLKTVYSISAVLVRTSEGATEPATATVNQKPAKRSVKHGPQSRRCCISDNGTDHSQQC